MVVPFERIEGDVDLRPGLGADLLADIEHRRLVALALADHHRAVDRQCVQLAPHRIDRRLVGGVLVAPATQPARGHRRALGHPRQLEREDAVERGTFGKALLLVHGGSGLQPNSSILIICGSSAIWPSGTDGIQGLTDRRFGGLVGDHDHRLRLDRHEMPRRRRFRRPPPLDDRFQRDALVRHALRDRGEGPRPVVDREPDVVPALVRAHRRPPVRLELRGRPAEGADPVAAGDVGDVAHHRRGGRRRRRRRGRRAAAGRRNPPRAPPHW